MAIEADFLNSRDKEKIWQRYCGFFDLSMAEFMEIQKHLLLEEIEMVAGSPLAQKLMKGAKPRNIEEFRSLAPFTTYDDYAPYIGDCQDDMLAAKPYCWSRTSGRGGRAKWVPYTQRAVDWLGRLSVAMVNLACVSQKGEIVVSRGIRLMHNLPPRPYYMGLAGWILNQQLEPKMMPPWNEYEYESFEKKTADGFRMALSAGVDCAGCLTSVLLRMGERFAESSRSMKITKFILEPRIMLRVMLALLKAKNARRKLLPKDLWPLKGLICYGMDTSIYREQLIHYWGKAPLELYGATETGMVAVQAWNKKDMTFFPFSCFLEFIPEEELRKSRDDANYTPVTVLLDEVEAGKHYEIVITSFYGMPFLRYRLGDLLKIERLTDEETGIKLPQMSFGSRADGLIDIAGFPRLDEKTVWQAIANTKVRHEDWSARKEFEEGKPILHIYLEVKDRVSATEMERLINQQLRNINIDYSDMQDMLGIFPIKVTLIPEGSFQRYYEARVKEGADLAHLKPPHVNAPEKDIGELTHLLNKHQEK